MSVNKVILVGHLGNDPDLREIEGGSKVANFSLATNERWKDKSGEDQEKTEWHRIVVWGKLAELAQQYLKKGRQVYIEGKLQTRSYQDKEGNTRYTTEVVGQTVQFLGSAGSGGGDRPPHSAEDAGEERKQASGKAKTKKQDTNPSDDDVPL